MQLKNGVDYTGVHPLLLVRLRDADNYHVVLTGEEMTVTSLRRPPSPGSRHSPAADVLVTAADIRRWRLDRLGKTEHFCRWLQTELDLGVLLEPDWMTKEQIEERGGIENIDPHIHSQLRIDPEEVGFKWVT